MKTICECVKCINDSDHFPKKSEDYLPSEVIEEKKTLLVSWLKWYIDSTRGLVRNGNWTEGSTIHNGNRTEWSPIRSVIIRVIEKLSRTTAKRESDLLSTSMINMGNRMGPSKIKD